MNIKIILNSDTPVYKQIVNFVKRSVASGELKNDEKLPSARDLSKQLLINPNTILKAYNELETENIVYNKKGLGTFINSKPSRLKSSEKNKIINEIIEHLIVESVSLGISSEELKKIIDKKIDSFSQLTARNSNAE